MAFDWGKLLEGAVTIGTGVYDYLNTDDVRSKLETASTAGIVDPFGQPNREKYQGELAALYNDPTSIQNQPGYQFRQKMGEQAINRNTAKSGHFRGGNRLHDLVNYNQGLASTAYNEEANRLSLLSGAQFAPNAAAYASLTESAGGAQQAGATKVGQTVDKITSPQKQGETSVLDSILGGLGINFDGASGDNDVLGGLSSIGEGLGLDLSGYGDDILGSIGDYTGLSDIGGDIGGITESVKGFAEEYGLSNIDLQGVVQRIASGEDPKEVLTETAMDYGKDMVKEKGVDWLKSEGADMFSEQTGMDLGKFGLGESFEAARELGGGAVEGATELAGLGPNADLGGADVASLWGDVPTGAAPETVGGSGTVLGEAGAGAGSSMPGTGGDWSFAADVADAKQQFSGGTAGSAAAGAAGGIVGGYLGSKIPGLGTDSPIGGYLGSVAGAGIGAGVVGGAAAAMAAAGPAAIAGMALIIGQGIYGVYKGAGARDHNRDEYRRVQGEMTVSGLVNDPTGGGYGQGYMHESGGHKFFAPEKFYKSVNHKRNIGEYLDYGSTPDMQGSYAAYYNPETQEWMEGGFTAGASGANTFDWDNWRQTSQNTGGGMLGGMAGTTWAEQQQSWVQKIADSRKPATHRWQSGEGGGSAPQGGGMVAINPQPAQQSGEGGGSYTPQSYSNNDH